MAKHPKKFTKTVDKGKLAKLGKEFSAPLNARPVPKRRLAPKAPPKATIKKFKSIVIPFLQCLLELLGSL